MKRIILGILVAVALLGGASGAYAATDSRGGRGNGVGGQVTAVNGSTITVSTHNGTATITTSADTQFTVNGATGSVSDITVGLYLHASGTRAADGSVAATKVVATTDRPQPPSGGHGRPGRGTQPTPTPST